ncbi:hypothetical protein BDR06DRAFT_955923 [Suillus hirtellus]|nr:hypothetical protein BDR06DRAFT_955923 [Suillus hirtellus]
MVFWNEIKPGDETAGKHVENSGEFGSVGYIVLTLFWTELFDSWHSLKVPNDVDLLKALHTGYCRGDTDPEGAVKCKEGKCSVPRQRQAKITNTHSKEEIGLSRDYGRK